MPGVLLAAAILLAAVALMLLKRWRSQPEAEESPHDQLAQFRRMYEQGELTREEYDRVHALLTQRIRQQTSPAAGKESPESPPGNAPEGSTGSGQKPEASPPAPQPETPSGDAAS